MRILLVDNYDSFTFNLVQLLRNAGADAMDVVKNDQVDMNSVEEYDKILISPGPGLPFESGVVRDLIRKFSPRKPILGVCLGHQAIGEVYGAALERLPVPSHGIQEEIQILKQDDPLFRGLLETIIVGLYNSWVISAKNFPSCLEVTAVAPTGTIMAISHRTYPLHGIQFHPESIMTPEGIIIVKNWIQFG